jgi:hypothetical protein
VRPDKSQNGGTSDSRPRPPIVSVQLAGAADEVASVGRASQLSVALAGLAQERASLDLGARTGERGAESQARSVASRRLRLAEAARDREGSATL